jgi:hypothetical protein
LTPPTASRHDDSEAWRAVSYFSLAEFIAAGEIDAAVEVALEHRTNWVEDQLDYDTLSDNAEHAAEFFHRWLSALPPLERLQAAGWATSQFLLPMVHLDHSYGTGAALSIEAIAAARTELASAMRDFWAFTDGPDAETPVAVAQQLTSYADQLDSMTFDPQRGASANPPA